MKRLTIFAASVLAASVASASVMEFSYNVDGVEPGYYGTKKKENYDIAIKIDNPALVGQKITGLKVAIPGDASLYTSPSAFLTTELVVERIDGVRVNVPDICSVDATIADGYLTATFAEPYTLTSDPVYVGYAVQVAELTTISKKPIAVVPGHNTNGFWLHSSRTQLKWDDYSNKVDEGMQSAMTVTLEGDFLAESAAVSLPERIVCLTGQENKYPFTVINGGTASISEIAYSWKIGDLKGEGNYKFETPINGSLGAKGTASLDMPKINDKGRYTINVTIDKINGMQNPNPSASAEGSVIFAPAIPVNRPLVEEYTGTWCGWCVRGYSVLEYMFEEHSSDFVAAAWHAGDPMSVTSAFPNSVDGYPFAYINRSIPLDPGKGLISEWETESAKLTDFSISCDLKYSDESKTAVTATATVNSIADYDNSYMLGFLLLADGLSNPKDGNYGQKNYYSGNQSAYNDLPGKYGDQFYNGAGTVMGLVFNDVALSTENVMGVPKSLPESIKAFEDYTYSVTYDISEFRTNFITPTASNPDANIIPINKDKIRVLAFIIAPDKTIVNSCTSNYSDGSIPEPSGVNDIQSDAEVVSTCFYDLQGRPATYNTKGILLRVETLSDGNIRVRKIAVK